MYVHVKFYYLQTTETMGAAQEIIICTLALQPTQEYQKLKELRNIGDPVCNEHLLQ